MAILKLQNPISGNSGPKRNVKIFSILCRKFAVYM